MKTRGLRGKITSGISIPKQVKDNLVKQGYTFTTTKSVTSR